MMRASLLSAAAIAAALVVPAHARVVNPTVPASRETDPVVLTGAQFGVDGDWSVPQNLTLRQPQAGA